MATDLADLLEPAYLGDLPGRSMDEVRAMRAECQEVETGLSLLRRLVQGRLDIVGLELQPPRRRVATPATSPTSSRGSPRCCPTAPMRRGWDACPRS